MEASNPYAAPTTEVRDITPPGDAQPLADRATRLGAALLDGLAGALLIYLPIILVAGLDSLVVDNSLNYRLFIEKAGIGGLLGGLLLIGINVYLVHRNGQTVGKRIVGIKVIRKDGSRATLGRIFWLRNVPFYVVSIIPIAGPIVSLVDTLLIFRASRQCLHDQVAGTIVVST